MGRLGAVPVDQTRVAFAVIPGEPHFSAIVKASAAITAEKPNRNIIDTDRFPPHLSLHICTIPTGQLAGMFTHLATAAPQEALSAPLTLGELREGSSGYITLDLTATPAVMDLHEWTLQAAATARGHPATPGTESAQERYGSTWIRNHFCPHYSIAKVDHDDQHDAYEIAAETLTGLPPAPVASFQVCDIGAHSEKWETLYQLNR